MNTRIFGYSVKNILRNKFLSVSSILVLTLLMFFINVLLFLNQASENFMQQINEKMSISLYLKEDYNDVSVEVVDLMDDIKKVDPKIEIRYKTQEEIIDGLRDKDLSLVGILEKYSPPETIDIANISLKDYEAINYIIEGKLAILDNSDEYDFAKYTTQYNNIMRVTSLLSMSKWVLLTTIVIFCISIAIISYSVISNFIYYYRDEIYITKLVGGAKNFIYGPFVIQGIIYALVSYLISLAVFTALLEFLETSYPLYDFSAIQIPASWFLFELLVFVLIGAVSGYFSSIKHVSRDTLKGKKLTF